MAVLGVGSWLSGRTAEEKLAHLRELILNARAMPMSASCVINRGDVLAAIDDVIDNLPDEIADAQQVIDRSAGQDRRGRGRGRPDPGRGPRARGEPGPAQRGGPGRRAAGGRDAGRGRGEAAALRRETDEFIDSRMAGFESVLHKTASQVRTARARLAERSGLDTGELRRGCDQRTFAE